MQSGICHELAGRVTPHAMTLSKRATRRGDVQGFVYQNRLDSTMAIQKLAQGGRPSKGPRHTFVVKPDLARAEKLRAIMDILGTNAVDYLTPLVARHIDSIDLEQLRNQETLPIPKAS